MLALNRTRAHAAFALLLGSGSCTQAPTYSDDLELVRSRVEVVELATSPDGPRLAVVPAWQGRVLTSAFAPAEPSLGWIHRAFIASGETRRGMNPYGGEERLWLGPEGGRFGLYFAPGAPQELHAWQTPACLDSEPWTLVEAEATRCAMKHRASLVNAAGTRFEVEIGREVRLLDAPATERALGFETGELEVLCYETRNVLRNDGDEAWGREGGLLSLWILSMLPPGPRTNVVVPLVPDPEGHLGTSVRSDYFGALPPDRLRIEEGAVYLRADGQYRSKIGVPPQRATPVLGAWNPERGVLSLASFNLPEGPHPFVESRWNEELPPYDGDAVNAYNDGPPAPGAAPLGPFFELESSSPGLALAPGEIWVHLHRTFHLRGKRSELDAAARETLGVGLDEIENAFRGPAR